MQRRHFLWTLGAAALMPAGAKAQAPQNATVLYDGHAITLDRVSPDPKQPAALWVQKTDLPRINGFELKPQGACRADICIPVPKTMTRGAFFNLRNTVARYRRHGDPWLEQPCAAQTLSATVQRELERRTA